jgi:hypothetical protein
VVKPKRIRKKKDLTTAREIKRRERAAVMPTQSINLPKPSGAWKEGRRVQGQAARMNVLPHTPRASVLTVTLSGAAKTSYTEVLAQARNQISLRELGVEKVEMRKAATGAIIIRVPGDKERDKAAKVASKLAGVLDPAAVKIAALLGRAELKVERIDVSVNKEELRYALVLAAGCKGEEIQVEGIQVEEIGTARGGLGTAWVRCPVAGARRLARERRVAVGWFWATVTAIPKRPLQCFRCLELGHVRATCTSAVDRGNLCHRCGRSGHKAKECTAVKPNCPLCEALGVPAGHRMVGIACAPSPPPEDQKKESPWKGDKQQLQKEPHESGGERPGGGHGD